MRWMLKRERKKGRVRFSWVHSLSSWWWVGRGASRRVCPHGLGNASRRLRCLPSQEQKRRWPQIQPRHWGLRISDQDQSVYGDERKERCRKKGKSKQASQPTCQLANEVSCITFKRENCAVTNGACLTFDASFLRATLCMCDFFSFPTIPHYVTVTSQHSLCKIFKQNILVI